MLELHMVENYTLNNFSGIYLWFISKTNIY